MTLKQRQFCVIYFTFNIKKLWYRLLITNNDFLFGSGSS